MGWSFKKEKRKAGLELPSLPETKKEIDIPDKFHEVKFSKEEPKEVFKSIAEVTTPDIPEMPELPDIPDLPEEKIAAPPEPQIQEGPIFVKSRDYQEILGKINKIKENVEHTEEIFKRMSEIKNEKDKIFGKWKENLEDVQRKLIYIEKSLFEA